MDVIFALVLATATPGGGFPVYGDALTEIVNAHEPRLRIQLKNTRSPPAHSPSRARRFASSPRPDLIHPRVRRYLAEAGLR